jgi:outer membrane lipoprotein SlyB
MKKLTAFLMAFAILMAVAATSFAQGRNRRCDSPSGRTSQTYYDNSQVYYAYDQPYGSDQQYRGRNFWDRHRDKLTLAAGAAGGAAMGGLIGGGRGAAIGALAGLGGSALYTYKLRNRGYRY